ncbi:MAG TPA: hypothetical protein VK718_03215 [Ferruginibacter sp.]|jgi:hypothetical protein|nr:hypothetical protein [Ferruginibacter sp.]
MKKIIVLLCLVLASTLTFAQTIDEVKGMMNGADWDPAQAKDAVDKYLSNPKNAKDANGYFYKAVIYNKYSKDPELKSDCPDCKLQAFEALKKCKDLDKKNTLLLLDQNRTFIDLYNGSYQAGVDAYNDKKYTEAFNNFKNTLTIGDYMRDKEIAKVPILDTPVVLNAGLAEQADKNDSLAVFYYQKLVNANVSGAIYDGVYQYLVYYYKSTKNDAAYNKTLAQAEKLYPDDSYFKGVESDKSLEGLSKDQLFKKYDDMLQKDPSNYDLSYDYGVELYNYVYANPDSSIRVESYKPRVYDQLKKTIAIKSTPEDNLMMARYLYNSSFDKSDAAAAVKGGSPESIKKRKALNDGALADMNECIPYAEIAANFYGGLPSLKAAEKENYKASLLILENIYEAKKDAAKQAAYTAKIKALN